MRLTELLHPLPAPAFFDTHWGRQPVVLKGEAGRFASLFSSRDVGRLLTYRPPRSLEDMLLIKDGRHRAENWLTPEGLPRLDQVRAAWREGYTLVINRLERLWEPVGRLGRALEEELHHPVSTNLYLTPAGARGFPPHFDVMDGFVLQLEGSKTWRVHGPQVESPLADEHTATSADHLPPLLFEQTLESGDVLYLPRGFVHSARTSEKASVHLTLGVQPVTWNDLLCAALSAARSDPRLREALPPRFLEDSAPLETRFQSLLEQLAGRLELGGALAHLAERLVVQKPPLPDEGLLLEDAVLEGNAVLGRREGVVLRVVEGPGYAALQYSGGKLVGPAKIAPALRHISRHAVVSVRSLPGLSPKEQEVLAGRLVRDGILIAQGPS
ncbi:MAG: cupin domain-containing protein [Cystobacter sp.]